MNAFAATPSFEASAPVPALVHEAALALGASAGQALQAARTGVVGVGTAPTPVTLVCTPHEDALVACIPLHRDALDAPEARRHALRTCVDTLARHDAVICRGADGPQLVGRRGLRHSSPASIAEWIGGLVALAATVPGAAAAPGR